ncbi:MAG: ribonuclease HII [Aureibaculum sp.]
MILQNNFSGHKLEAGTDEAGRGCLAGPVVAAAVILPQSFDHPILNDSKQLTEKQRLQLKPYIEEKALAYAVSFVWQQEIDKINILQSSLLAMHKALAELSIEPEFIIIDGNKFNTFKSIPHQTIVKGDGKYMSIAAASILAKTYRDEYMEKIHEEFPEYNWKQNKGYPTREHREIIQKNGITLHHRRSFRLYPEQLSLEL